MPESEVASTPLPRGETGEAMRILLVEDNEDYAVLVERTLGRSELAAFQVDFRRIERQSYEAMLLDLSLPDGYGAFTVSYGCSIANHLPVLVLTGICDDGLAMTAMRAGAQEYLVKDRVGRGDLPGMILRAIERKRRLEKLWALERSRGADAGDDALGLLYDPRTGSATAPLLRDRLENAIARAERSARPLGVLLIRLDDFDVLREMVGSATSDELLCAAAQRLRGRVRRSDSFAFLEPDRFAVVLEGTRSRQDVACAAQGLLDSLSQVRIADPAGVEVRTATASIGVALYPEDGADGDALLAQAERAQRAACERGGNHFRFASPSAGS
jgi:two-component system cell cycle response regulator